MSGAASSTYTASAWRRRHVSNGGVTSSTRSGGFDLTSQRSGEGVEEITILPMAGATGESRLSETNSQPLAEQRQSLLELLPAGTLVIEEASGAYGEEVSRAWREAEH